MVTNLLLKHFIIFRRHDNVGNTAKLVPMYAHSHKNVTLHLQEEQNAIFGLTVPHHRNDSFYKNIHMCVCV